MWNEPTKEELRKIPRLYETEDTPLKDKLIYLHFFIGGSDWYIAEYDGEDLFFGYAILNGDEEMAEWGYVSFRELRELKIHPGFEVDCDRFWEVRKAGQVEKIKAANGWQDPNTLREASI
jgi:hypothetical protein